MGSARGEGFVDNLKEGLRVEKEFVGNLKDCLHAVVNLKENL